MVIDVIVVVDVIKSIVGIDHNIKQMSNHQRHLGSFTSRLVVTVNTHFVKLKLAVHIVCTNQIH